MERDVINVQEAATILSQRAGRTIKPDYIRELRKRGRLKAINEPEEGVTHYTRAYLFNRTDVEQITIGLPRTRGVRRPRKRKSHEFSVISETHSKNT